MVQRPVFVIDEKSPFFCEKAVEFEYSTGFAFSQKQKTIENMHTAIRKRYGERKILEVSRYSKEKIGRELSAFNLRLMYKEVNATVEAFFQSSKVFEKGGPYIDLLYGTSIDAKRDVRLINSGSLIEFDLLGEKFPTDPKTLFYDWIYLNALAQTPKIFETLIEYDSFTDIAFNPKKSINCQAQSVAIGVSLFKKGVFYDVIADRKTFKNTIYKAGNKIEYCEQVALFD